MNAEWFRVVEAAVEAVHGAAADRGLVVVLDDMHRGDEPSLLILRHLADRLAASRIARSAPTRSARPS